MKRRLMALMLALALFVLTPAGDYLGTYETRAASTAFLTASEYVIGILLTCLGLTVVSSDLDIVVDDIGTFVETDSGSQYADVYTDLLDFSFGFSFSSVQDILDMVKAYILGYTVSDAYENPGYSVSVNSDIYGRSSTVGDTITLPGDYISAEELLEIVQATSTAEERLEALTPALTVIYGGKSDSGDSEDPEDTDGSLAWLPDITGAIDRIGETLSGFSLSELFESVVSAISDNAFGIMSYIRGASETLSASIATVRNDLAFTISNSYASFTSQLQFVISPLQSLNGYLQGILPAMLGLIGSISDSVSGIPGSLEDILDGLLDVPGRVVDGVGRAVESAGEALGEKIEGVKDFFEPLVVGMQAVVSAVSGIPQHLIDILNAVKAIPGQIQDFFTVDMVAVGASASALRETFIGKFEPFTALVGVFKDASGSMNDEIPVIKMKVPLRLAEVVGGEEIVVFDLRGYEEYVTLFRNLVRCSIWISFAFAVMAMFRVRFHIG